MATKAIIVKKGLALLNSPRLILHIALYLVGVGGGNLRLDIAVAAKHHGFSGCRLMELIYLLTFDRTFRNVFYYRIGTWKLLCSWLIPCHNSFVIGKNTIIEGAFLGIHPIGTTINAKYIGSGFVCRNNTVIGVGRGGLTTIGNNVDVGTNSVIIGGIHIGDNVRIGVGSVVVKSIPDNCTVVGNPAHIIKKDGLRIDKDF